MNRPENSAWSIPIKFASLGSSAAKAIGRAAALEFAKKGATFVLAARREEALRKAARTCEQHGARTLIVPTDVTNEAEVDALARTAIEHFGRIDILSGTGRGTARGHVGSGQAPAQVGWSYIGSSHAITIPSRLIGSSPSVTNSQPSAVGQFQDGRGGLDP